MRYGVNFSWTGGLQDNKVYPLGYHKNIREISDFRQLNQGTYQSILILYPYQKEQE